LAKLRAVRTQGCASVDRLQRFAPEIARGPEAELGGRAAEDGGARMADELEERGIGVEVAAVVAVLERGGNGIRVKDFCEAFLGTAELGGALAHAFVEIGEEFAIA